MILLFGLLGLVVGGVVNQLGTDLAARRPLGLPRCAYCGRARPWFQFLALPSAAVGREGCPSCGAPTPVRASLIEIGLAVTFAYLWIAVGPSIRLALYALYSTVFALVLVTDLDRRRIPNAAIYPAIALAVAAAFFTPGLAPGVAIAGGLAGLAAYSLIALIGRVAYGPGAMGWGDVKLATFIGLVMGFPTVLVVIVVAILAAGVTSLFLIATGLRGRRDPIPYGPFLVGGAAVAAVWGRPILTTFLS